MAKEIWVVEVNLESDPLEYRVETSSKMLRENATRALIKANDPFTSWKGSYWVVIGMAESEEEAHQKTEKFKGMAQAEREHAIATGESLYLKREVTRRS